MPVPDRSPPRATRHAGEKPFNNAEEAWFWFMSWRLMVEDGGTPGYDGRGRPCMPLDMLACLRRLVKPGRLTRRHLQVLAGFGRRLEAPGHGPLARLWDEGMARLEEVFRAKGIVAPPRATRRIVRKAASAPPRATRRAIKMAASAPPQSQGLPA